MTERWCDVCEARSKHRTRREAEEACEDHLEQTAHLGQFVDYGQGWTYWLRDPGAAKVRR